MEPMSLGSPVSSPVQTPCSPTGTSLYLPSFLLGDANTPNKTGVTSPQDGLRNLNMTNYNVTSPISQYGTPDYRINRQKSVFGQVSTPTTTQIGTESHTCGPPIRGLFDTLETSPTATPQTPVIQPNSANSHHNQSKNLMNMTNSSMLFPDSPLNLNANESQGLLQWVTVFGFPPNALNTVLSHISSRVRIIDKHPPPLPQSNWIHLKCASEQEIQRALACNGNIVFGSIMIGVIPCIDEGVVLGEDKKNRSKLNESMRSFNKINQSKDQNTPCTPVRIQNARPLAVGYSQQLSPQSVVLPSNVPQKCTGVISKAMEYVFGW